MTEVPRIVLAMVSLSLLEFRDVLLKSPLGRPVLIVG